MSDWQTSSKSSSKAKAPAAGEKAKGIGEASPFAVLKEVNLTDGSEKLAIPSSPKKQSAPNSPSGKKGAKKQEKSPLVVPSVVASVVETAEKEQKPMTPKVEKVVHYNTTKLSAINVADLNVFIENLVNKKSNQPLKELCDYLEERIQALEVFTVPYGSPKYVQPHLDWEERTDIPYGLYRAVSAKFRATIVKYIKSLSTTAVADGLVAIVRGFVEGQKKAITTSSTHCRQTLAHEVLIQIICSNLPHIFFCESTSKGTTAAHDVLSHYRTLIFAHPAVGHSLLWVCGQQVLSALNPHLMGFEYWIEYFAPIFFNAEDANVSVTVQMASIDYLESILSSMEAVQTKRVLLDCAIPTLSLENYKNFLELAVSKASPLLKKKKNADVLLDRLRRCYAIIRAMAFAVNRVEVLKFNDTTVELFGYFISVLNNKGTDFETRTEVEGICTMLIARDFASETPTIGGYWLGIYQQYPTISNGIFARILSLSQKKGKIWSIMMRSKEFRKFLDVFNRTLSSKRKQDVELTKLQTNIQVLIHHGRNYEKSTFEKVFPTVLFFIALFFAYYCVAFVACKPDSASKVCEITAVANENAAFVTGFYGKMALDGVKSVLRFLEPAWQSIAPLVYSRIGWQIEFVQNIIYGKDTQQLLSWGMQGLRVAASMWHDAAHGVVYLIIPQLQEYYVFAAKYGWGCCSKRVAEFNDFLKIPGCTVGRHRVEAIVEAPKPIPKAASSPHTIDANGKEVYGKAPTPVVPSVASALKVEAKPEVLEESLNDPADAKIEMGTSCKRRGCKHSFAGESSKTDECVFHNGVPIFHEGSKGWSCCSRKVLEFEEFLKLPGCRRGKHRFTQQESQTVTEVTCRHDWYQTPSTVIVSIFAKKVNKERSTVTFKEQELRAELKFDDGKQFTFLTPLSLPILPEESKYVIMGTKVEIVLKKANGLSWPSLEPQEGVVSWTTFGVNGGVGTVGSTEAIIAQDAPLHLLKK
ncbi:hypothetical protein HDU97_009750 [Phlyctochytrium planicorne]|nr:hypothetical protein HDU97_009750 [Phlyctochytrium planicorne]